ncbi:hypothetical protein BDQ12DRAFT_65380 [Crucibulum laeve]|uniref:Uncharacterized protein n=1 Tax=Crucibulum laeve TaxID=68775 RepID=A0A5C3LT64_9AGAR|nr:hypothetical protein BDQ12DRAFT_65380 [Crucibulum laeve]
MVSKFIHSLAFKFTPLGPNKSLFLIHLLLKNYNASFSISLTQDRIYDASNCKPMPLPACQHAANLRQTLYMPPLRLSMILWTPVVFNSRLSDADLKRWRRQSTNIFDGGTAPSTHVSGMEHSLPPKRSCHRLFSSVLPPKIIDNTLMCEESPLQP